MTIEWLQAHVEEWHDVWEVVGALATAVAVIIALLGITGGRRAARRAEARAARAEEDLLRERRAADAARVRADLAQATHRRREQALRVIGWPEFAREQEFVGGSYTGRWRIVVGNFSEAPVFDLRAEALNGGNNPTAFATAAVLAPGECPSVETDVTDESRSVRAVVYFRDVAGVRWRRNHDGDLQEVDERRQPVGPEAEPLHSTPTR